MRLIGRMLLAALPYLIGAGVAYWLVAWQPEPPEKPARYTNEAVIGR